MKRVKLMSLICAFLFSISILIVGIFSVVKTEIPFSGNLHFDARDLDVDIVLTVKGVKDSISTKYLTTNIARNSFATDDAYVELYDLTGKNALNLQFDEHTAIVGERNKITIDLQIYNFSTYNIKATARLTEKPFNIKETINNAQLIQKYQDEVENDKVTIIFEPIDLYTEILDQNEYFIQVDIEPYEISTDFRYTISNKEVIIDGLTEKGLLIENLEIPSNIEGLPVTKIAEKAFENNQTLKSVILPNTIQDMGSMCFQKCSNLASVTIPNNIKEITGQGIFNKCTSLDNVILPNSLRNLPTAMFAGCSSLKNITLPKDLRIIEGYAFQHCSALKSITLPESVTEIGQATFVGTSLENIQFPEKIEKLGYAMFGRCITLKSIKIPSSVKVLPDSIFQDCSSLETVELNEGLETIGYLSFLNTTSLKEITIPSTVKEFVHKETQMSTGNTRLLNGAFSSSGITKITYLTTTDVPVWFAESSALQSFIAPNSVKNINSYAFYNCASLTEVSLPDGLLTIEESSFYKCSSLEEIELPDSIENIGPYAFSTSDSRLKLSIPQNIKYIGTCAFQYANIENIDLPEGLLFIGDYAFNHVVSSNTKITIPSTVTQIGGKEYGEDFELGTHIFYNCANSTLTKFEVAEGNQYYSADEFGVLYTKNFEIMIAYPSASSYTAYELHENCKKWYEKSFSRAFNLKNLTLSNSFEITATTGAYSNIADGLYHFTTVEKLYVKDDNPKYFNHKYTKTVDGEEVTINDGIIYGYTESGKVQLVAIAPANKGTDGIIEIWEGCEEINYIFAYWGGTPPSAIKISKNCVITAGGEWTINHYGLEILYYEDEASQE